jgi:hypothetical protein
MNDLVSVFLQLAMERELASMWELSFVVPPDHGMHAALLSIAYLVTVCVW